VTALTRLTVAAAGCWLLAQAAPRASGQVPLSIRVAYPAPRAALDIGDSTFIFGSVSDRGARLSVAGVPVTVAPNGAWLAWVAVPHDSSFAIRLVARMGRDSVVQLLPLSRAGWVRETGAWVDRHSPSPVGDIRMPTGEPLSLTVRAAPGATVRLFLGNGDTLRFRADSIGIAPREGLRAFDHDDRNLLSVARGDRYVAVLYREINPVRAPWDSIAEPTRDAATPLLEVALGRDTTRILWPALRVTRGWDAPASVVLGPTFTPSGGVASTHLGGNASINIGRAFPTGTYAWFFPTGTRTHVDMRIGDQVRLRLSRDAVAWVPLADVHRAAAPDDARTAIMGSPTLTADSGRVRLRIPLSHAVPHRVDETERGVTITLFDAVSNANWTRYGADQQFVQLLTWKQESEDRVTLSLSFDRPLWGWRVRLDGTDLVFDFREPPAVDAANPLRGRLIVIDPGHPPGGACGPTNLCEPEVNLNIASAVRDQLVAAGAVVIMTRTDSADVDLWPRVALADSLDADLMISIHNNAFPDGVNPFTNGGTSTFFNHPQSLALARAVQSRLVARIGLPDLGVARGDLALTRPTWYPAILTEGFHMMFPEQEAMLRTPEGRGKYAAGVVEGITAFLRGVARGSSRQ